MMAKIATGAPKRQAMRPALRIGVLTGVLIVAGMAHVHAEERKGQLDFAIRDDASGTPIPGKLVFLKKGEPVDLGLVSAGHLACRENTVYTSTGRGTIRVPAGEYEVIAARGLEYGIDRQVLAVPDSGSLSAEFRIQPQVDTPGYIAGDLHLHTVTFSGHGDANVAERLISCIGEGLEWAVATDHNHVTDYDTVKAQLPMQQSMLTTVGNEISTPIGHFNAFPLPRGSAPTPSEEDDANSLFRLIRALPGKPVILVNHPRWPGGDYFTLLGLHRQLGVTDNPRWSPDFDAFELLNENRGLGWRVERQNPIPVRDDWFNFMNRGQFYTAIGNSDSHDVLGIVAGLPRNYVASSTDDPAQLDEVELAENIRRGNVSVSSGIYVEVTANAKPMGTLLSHGVTPNLPNDVTPSLTGGVTRLTVPLRVRIQAATWISCDTVQVIENGIVIRTLRTNARDAVVRLDTVIAVSPELDSWYIVTASGSESMAPVYHDAPVPLFPLGFSNPIRIDADGNGRFTPMKAYADRLVSALPHGRDTLLASVARHPAMAPFAAHAIAEKMVADTPDLLEKLAAFAQSSTRPFILAQMGALPGGMGLPGLGRLYSKSEPPALRFANLLAQSRQGNAGAWPRALAVAGEFKETLHLRNALRDVQSTSLFESWVVKGPYESEAEDAFEQQFGPESELVGQTDWQGREIRAQSGRIDLASSFGRLENTVVFARTRFEARRDGRVIIRMGSNDGVVVWMNGKQVHSNHQHRGLRPDSDIFVVRVARGRNDLVLKVENARGSWGFAVAAIDASGEIL